MNVAALHNHRFKLAFLSLCIPGNRSPTHKPDRAAVPISAAAVPDRLARRFVTFESTLASGKHAVSKQPGPGARRQQGWRAAGARVALAAMHPPLIPEKHPLCAEVGGAAAASSSAIAARCRRQPQAGASTNREPAGGTSPLLRGQRLLHRKPRRGSSLAPCDAAPPAQRPSTFAQPPPPRLAPTPGLHPSTLRPSFDATRSTALQCGGAPATTPSLPSRAAWQRRKRSCGADSKQGGLLCQACGRHPAAEPCGRRPRRRTNSGRCPRRAHAAAGPGRAPERRRCPDQGRRRQQHVGEAGQPWHAGARLVLACQSSCALPLPPPHPTPTPPPPHPRTPRPARTARSGKRAPRRSTDKSCSGTRRSGGGGVGRAKARRARSQSEQGQLEARDPAKGAAAPPPHIACIMLIGHGPPWPPQPQSRRIEATQRCDALCLALRRRIHPL
jgi:hypothetical protein